MDLTFFIGLIIGVVLEAIIATIREVITTARGTLRIDHSNPEKDLYRFEINDLDCLNKKKYVELKIEHNTNISQ